MTNSPVITPEARTQQAAQLATSAGWQAHTIRTNSFTLQTYGSRVRGKNKILTIYIEGDGLAWIAGDMPSENPTPVDPVGLKMAIRDSTVRRPRESGDPEKAYLARPCQFVWSATCRPAYWTNLRFSPEVVSAMNQGVSELKKYYRAEQIKLVGYSGGGTIAALIAARRTDVVKLVTVAAMLDMKQWVDQKSLTPLYGSLNPADEWKKLASIPQTHWVGGKDTVVPKEVAFAFANRFPAARRPEVKVMSDFDHTCCWTTTYL